MSSSYEHDRALAEGVGKTDDSGEGVSGIAKMDSLAVAVKSSTSSESSSASPSSSSTKSSSRSAMPWSVLVMIYGTIAGDAFALNIVTPFMPKIVDSQYGVSPALNSLAAGALGGAFSLATFVSSFFLGHLSDHIGRRPLMLFGLLTSGICTIAFSVVQSFGAAFFIRSFAGFTNSNIALCKAFISDLPISADDRAVAYAYQGAAFQLSRLLASTVAGITVGVIIFGYDNPFFFPSAIGGGMNMIFFSLGLFLLPESLKRTPPPSATDEEDNGAVQQTHCDGLKKIFTDLLAGLRIIRSDSLLMRLIVISSINSFSNGSVLMLITLFFHLSISFGGLQYDPLYTGLGYAYFGLVAVVFQFGFYKQIHKKFGIYKAYLYGSATLGSGCVILPVSALFFQLGDPSPLTHSLTVFVLIIGLSLMSIGFMLCLPLVNAMLANAGDRSRQGLIQGTAMSVNSLCRGFGPIVSGALFSVCILIPFPPLVFWLVACCNVVCWAMAKRFRADEKLRVEGKLENGNAEKSRDEERKRMETEVTHTIDEFDDEEDEHDNEHEQIPKQTAADEHSLQMASLNSDPNTSAAAVSDGVHSHSTYVKNDDSEKSSVAVELPLSVDDSAVNSSIAESAAAAGSGIVGSSELSAAGRVRRFFAPSGYEQLQTNNPEAEPEAD